MVRFGGEPLLVGDAFVGTFESAGLVWVKESLSAPEAEVPGAREWWGRFVLSNRFSPAHAELPKTVPRWN